MKKALGTMVAIMMVAILGGTFITANYATAGEKARDGRFIAYDNGTVLDTKTKLMWAAKDNEYDIYWQDAKSYCQNYRRGGYTDWRMPTQDELAGLYDGSVNGHNGYHLTNLITLTACCPWASETQGIDVARFDFNAGTRFWYHSHSADGERVLPVRSGK
jgi:hypothetical protein